MTTPHTYEPGDLPEVNLSAGWVHEGRTYVAESKGWIIYESPDWDRPGRIAAVIDCLTGASPRFMTLEINREHDDEPRLHVSIGGEAVVVPFDAVIDAATELRDRSRHDSAA